MILPPRHVNRVYTWNKPDCDPMPLGKLVKIETLPHDPDKQATVILHFADGSQIIDDYRVTEVKRGLFGGVR